MCVLRKLPTVSLIALALHCGLWSLHCTGQVVLLWRQLLTAARARPMTSWQKNSLVSPPPLSSYPAYCGHCTVLDTVDR